MPTRDTLSEFLEDKFVRGFVKVRYGNVFDEPADLILLPCSMNGGMTDFVRRSAVHFGLPSPASGLAKFGGASSGTGMIRCRVLPGLLCETRMGDNAQWVETLAEFLRGHGIDARLDTWHLHFGADL